jgi:hypothetical protein
VAYPDYSGTLGDFVRGVVCILRLQRDRALPGFLYDDFIRVFSSDFLDYIATVDRNQPALPAIQWYNENVTRPLYQKGVLNKHNIKDILGQYPDKLRAIQQQLEGVETSAHRQLPAKPEDAAGEERQMAQGSVIKISTSHVPQKDAAILTSVARDGVNADRAVSSFDDSHTTQGWQSVRDSSAPIAQSTSSPRVPEQAPSPQPNAEPDEPGSAVAEDAAPRQYFSHNEVESSLHVIKPTQTPRLANIGRRMASTMPSNVLSQVSNADSIPETTFKRRRQATGAASSAGPSTAGPGAAFKRPRRSGEDFDKRMLRWKQFLVSKRTQSSAPGGSGVS